MALRTRPLRRIFAVDYDMAAVTPVDFDCAYIELLRGGKMIVPDVFKDFQELAGKCLANRDDERAVSRS